MTEPDHGWLLDAVADPAHGWSVGTFGAIAEFVRDPDEPARLARSGTVAEAATARGALRLAPLPGLVPVAYETPNRDGEGWSHAVALCLPGGTCAMTGRTVLSELGPDADAIRPEDRDAILFDMGLGTLQIDVCVRTRDPALLAQLRAGAGQALAAPGNPAMGAIVAAGPNRVFVSRLGRAEVFQPIPPPGGVSPEGPHTHVLPKLLRAGRTHAATTPIPDGLVPCAHLFPPHPARTGMGARKPFDPAAHAQFQTLLARFGHADALRLKHVVAGALAAGTEPPSRDPAGDKHARGALRVALRQAAMTVGPSAALERWRAAFDRARDGEPAEDDEQPAH